jgi:long-chain acyl-CoA synthetase
MAATTYPTLAAARLSSDPDSRAFEDDTASETFAQLTECAWRVATGLRKHIGLDGRDCFAVLASSSTRYAGLWHVAAWGGGVVCPLNSRLSAPELAAVLRDARPAALFVDATHGALLDAAAAEGIPDCPVIVLDDTERRSARPFSDIVDSSTAPAAPASPDPGDSAMLMYTAGTTGRAKGVVHSHANLCAGGVVRTSSFLPFDAATRFYQVAPMYHIMSIVGNLAVPVFGGATVVRGGLDIGRMLDDIDRHKLTHVAMVPTLLSMLLTDPRFHRDRLESLRLIAYGGSPMPPALLDQVGRELPAVQLVNSYGMTEVCGSLTALSPADHAVPDRLGTVGRALPGVILRVVDADGVECAPGQPGEVLAVTDSRFVEYRGDPERTARVQRHGAEYATGDVGSLDPFGYLTISERIDDMIVTGGENVFSSEIEAVIAAIPGVRQAAVVGVPDPKWGSAVHAAITVEPGTDLDPDAVIGRCREALAGFKVPKTVEIIDGPLPLTATNKVDKVGLRTRAAAASTT